MYRRCLPLLQLLLTLIYRIAVKKHGTPDIIHTHFYSIAAIASTLKKKYGIPFIVTEHSSKLNREKTSISKLDQELAQVAYSYANEVIAVSNSLSEHLSTNFGINCIVINNIVNSDIFKMKSRIRQDLFTFISVGNLIESKGFNLLINSFKQAHFSSNVSLRIIGDGVEMKQLKATISSLGLNDSVQLLGVLNREKIVQEMMLSDAFALASESETFGLAYVEAMLTGLPVIATKCGGPEEFVDDSNGFLIPKNDPLALTEALKQMYATCYQFDSKLISETCRNRFSEKTISEQIIKVYSSYL